MATSLAGRARVPSRLLDCQRRSAARSCARMAVGLCGKRTTAARFVADELSLGQVADARVAAAAASAGPIAARCM